MAKARKIKKTGGRYEIEETTTTIIEESTLVAEKNYLEQSRQTIQNRIDAIDVILATPEGGQA